MKNSFTNRDKSTLNSVDATTTNHIREISQLTTRITSQESKMNALTAGSKEWANTFAEISSLIGNNRPETDFNSNKQYK